MEKISLTKLTNIENMEKALTISKRIKTLEKTKIVIQKKKNIRSNINVNFDIDYGTVKVLLSNKSIIGIIDKAIEEEINNLLELGFTL